MVNSGLGSRGLLENCGEGKQGYKMDLRKPSFPLRGWWVMTFLYIFLPILILTPVQLEEGCSSRENNIISEGE